LVETGFLGVSGAGPAVDRRSNANALMALIRSSKRLVIIGRNVTETAENE